MIYERPSLTEYIFARVITAIIFVTIIYSIAIIYIPKEYQNIIFYIGLFWASLLVILSTVYISIKKIKRELKRIENYLLDIDLLYVNRRESAFSTKEFEDINKKLICILNKIKRDDKKKRKYTAKIKLKNRQRSDMLSAIAHEFRNPIASIMGYAQTLNDDDSIPPALKRKFLNKIYNNGEKIEELLSRLLLWNRFENGKQKLQLSKFDIYPLVVEIVSNLEDRYKNRKIYISRNKLNVYADKALIEIVLKNLIENALKYSKDIVEIRIENNRVSIIDKGVGISSKNIEKVTKKFFRTDEHTWDNSMGLGLAIVKQILKLHNSFLRIESKEHQGSSFSFELSLDLMPNVESETYSLTI